MNQKNDDYITQCWKQTGIFGDATCPKLKDFAHCKKCPKYLRAAKNLFDQEIPEGYREECTNLFASGEETEIPGTIYVVVFRLKNEWLALKTGYLQEVTEILPVHLVPFRTNNVFKGLVNINGELVPCVSVTDILGLTGDVEEVSNRAIYKRMIVVNKGGERFVFSVDEMLGIRRISPEDQQKTPTTLSKSSTALSIGIFYLDGKTVGLLDEVKFFQSLKRSLTF